MEKTYLEETKDYKSTPDDIVKYQIIANQYGGYVNFDENWTDETTHPRHILHLEDRYIFMRDNESQYHGYTFYFETPSELISLLKLINFD